MPRILESIHRGYGIFKGQDSAAGHGIPFDVFKEDEALIAICLNHLLNI